GARKILGISHSVVQERSQCQSRTVEQLRFANWSQRLRFHEVHGQWKVQRCRTKGRRRGQPPWNTRHTGFFHQWTVTLWRPAGERVLSHHLGLIEQAAQRLGFQEQEPWRSKTSAAIDSKVKVGTEPAGPPARPPNIRSKYQNGTFDMDHAPELRV